MQTPEIPFGERVKERAETYKTKSKELFDKVAGRAKKALEFLKDAPFLAAAFAGEASIEAAKKGKEAVRAAVEAIKSGASEAMKFGRDKKDQAVNFLSGIFEAAKTKVRNARDALVGRVNEARKRFDERIGEIKEARERARKEAELRRAVEEYHRENARLNALEAERAQLISRIRELEDKANRLWRELHLSPESSSSTS